MPVAGGRMQGIAGWLVEAVYRIRRVYVEDSSKHRGEGRSCDLDEAGDSGRRKVKEGKGSVWKETIGRRRGDEEDNKDERERMRESGGGESEREGEMDGRNGGDGSWDLGWGTVLIRRRAR